MSARTLAMPVAVLSSLSADVAPTVSSAPMAAAQWPGESLQASIAAKAFADNAMDKMRAYWKTAIVCRECGVIPCESPDDICQDCSEQALPCSKCNLNPREDGIEFCQKCFDKERIAKNALNSWFWRNTLKNP